MHLIPLQYVKPGSTAKVDHIDGDSTIVRRLQEMGLCPGCRLQVLCQGQGCIVKMSGSKLCFRDSEATKILVEVEPAA